MIPATHAHVAHFMGTDQTTGKRFYVERTVVAWDHNGNALIADERSGQLRPASDFPDFRGVWEGGHAVVAAVPGAGWHVAYTDGDDTEPVVAWLVHADGETVPITADMQAGTAQDAARYANFARLIPPTA